ncbi:hypothetical protein [Streptomyces sp. NPDC055085]
MERYASWFAAVTALATLSFAVAPAEAGDEWHRIGSSATEGVSGVTYEDQSDIDSDVRMLVVHDNKQVGQPRISRIEGRVGSEIESPIAWNGPDPVDLEAIEVIPGRPDEFMALASRGIIYHLRVSGSTAVVIDYSPLPKIDEGGNYESFAMVYQNGNLGVLWADRGDGSERSAKLFSATLSYTSWGQPQFGSVKSHRYKAPYPVSPGTRHISDISVSDSGEIFVSSASDGGDDGPFSSGVSYAGRIAVSETGRVRVSLTPNPISLKIFPEHKVEGIEFLPGTTDIFLGSDDENLGGSVAVMPLCHSLSHGRTAEAQLSGSCPGRSRFHAKGDAISN